MSTLIFSSCTRKSSFYLGFLFILVIYLSGCKEPDAEIVETPVFLSDTTADRVGYNTILTYQIYKDMLYPYQLYQPQQNPGFDAVIWNREKQNKETHQKIFRLFADIIPAESRSEINYFSIIYQDNSFASMSAQKDNSLANFRLATRPDLLSYLDSIPAFKAPKFRHNTLGYSLAVYTMIHEFGHYLTLNNRQSYLSYLVDDDSYSPYPKKGSIIDSILTSYWKPYLNDDIVENCLPKNGNVYFCFPPESFVSAYASTSFNEDAAESFAHFVLLDDKPQRTNAANSKILLFYQHPEFVKLRLAIRQNLKKLGFSPKPANMTE